MSKAITPAVRRRILDLMRAGKTNMEVAQAMSLAPHSMRTLRTIMIASGELTNRNQIDGFTRETVCNMVRYISDNQRIAKHVGISALQVSRIRKEEINTRAVPTYSPVHSERNENLHVCNETWAKDARQGSQALAKALAKTGRSL